MKQLFRKYQQALAYLLILLAGLVALHTYDNRSIDRVDKANRASIARVNSSAVAACKRLQTVRDQNNKNSFIIFDAYNQSIRRQRIIIQNPKTSKVQKNIAHMVIKQLRPVTEQVSVVAPTNCVRAVFDPNYEAPAPEFIWQKTPGVIEARKRLNIPELNFDNLPSNGNEGNG